MEVVWLVFAVVYLGMLSLVLYLLRRQRLAFEQAFEREMQRRNRMMAALLEDPMDPRGDGTIRRGDMLWEVVTAAQHVDKDAFVATDDEGHLIVSVDEQGARQEGMA